MLVRLALVCCFILWVPASADSNQWLTETNGFLAQDDLPGGWEIRSGRVQVSDDLILFKNVLKNLPSPDTWDDLEQSLADVEGSDAQRALLAVFVAYLNGDIAEYNARMKTLKAALPRGESSHSVKRSVQELTDALLTATAGDEPAALIEAFELRLTLAKKAQAENTAYGHSIDSIDVPDLVTIEGRDKAAARLGRALQMRVALNIEHADATLQLARKLALAQVDELKAPQWALTLGVDQIELYEAMAARFPETGRGYDYTRTQAKAFYLWGLVADGRENDAIQLIEADPKMKERLPSNALRALRSAGFGPEAWTFLHNLLAKYPEIDLWRPYIELSAELNRGEAMIATVQQAVEASRDHPSRAARSEKLLADAYLSNGKLKAGTAQLRKIISRDTTGMEAAEEQFQAAIQLGKIGLLTDNAEWQDLGAEAATKYLSEIELVSEHGRINAQAVIELADLYRAMGRGETAMFFLQNTLKNLNEPASGKNARSFGFNNKAEAHQRLLTAICGIHAAEGEYEAIIELLASSPQWQAKDLASILSITGSNTSGDRLGWIAAKALKETGDSTTAERILEGLMREENGYDAAYALYLELKGADAIPFFKKLHTIDQFEERPLIWMAQHHVNAGSLTKAEALATRAIRIDPSDGEQPKGDRMRVYGVMQQIRQAEGASDAAKFFADVLRAIRLAENADDWYAAGLHSAAIERYKESLEFFQDAYCIQSRLAVRLYTEGRREEAAIHYQKAYELMPSSFGRVESHCFGCESVFEGETPQAIAENVFQGMLKSQPDVPQVHYMMGYLREHQNKYDQALEHFKEATRLDPGYLSAWKQMLKISRRMAVDRATEDELAFKIYALDPLGRHSNPELHEVEDLKEMWRLIESKLATLSLIKKPDALFALTASAQSIGNANPPVSYSYAWKNPIEHPADALVKNEVIKAINETFVALSQKKTRQGEPASGFELFRRLFL